MRNITLNGVLGIQGDPSALPTLKKCANSICLLIHVHCTNFCTSTMVVPMVVPVYRWYGTISKCATLVMSWVSALSSYRHRSEVHTSSKSHYLPSTISLQILLTYAKRLPPFIEEERGSAKMNTARSAEKYRIALLFTLLDLRSGNGFSSCLYLQGFRVKEGLGCVLFHAVLPRKTRNLALPWLENPVKYEQKP